MVRRWGRRCSVNMCSLGPANTVRRCRIPKLSYRVCVVKAGKCIHVLKTLSPRANGRVARCFLAEEGHSCRVKLSALRGGGGPRLRSDKARLSQGVGAGSWGTRKRCFCSTFGFWPFVGFYTDMLGPRFFPLGQPLS